MNLVTRLRQFGLALTLAFCSLFGGVAGLGAVASLAVAPQAAEAQAYTNWYENRRADAELRAQSYVLPTTLYIGLETASGSDAGCGTEAAWTSYARASYVSSLTNWSGTQSAGSTTASTGTAGLISNNNAISFATPGSGPTTVTGFCVFDAGLTTLSAAIATTGATSMTVTAATQFPGSGSYYVLVDSEIIQVTAGAGTTTWTIARGAFGSTAATHSSGAAVSGMPLWRNTLTASKTINSGDTVQFPAASLTWSID